jgi:phage terminase small subunit
MPEKLTLKDSEFIDAYLAKRGNGAAAARASGTSPANARFVARRTLARPAVAAEIARRRAKVERKAEISREDAVVELSHILRARMTDYLEFSVAGVKLRDSDELTPGQLAAIAEISATPKGKGRKLVRLKLHDKLAAFDSLARTLGWNVPERAPVDEQGRTAAQRGWGVRSGGSRPLRSARSPRSTAPGQRSRAGRPRPGPL